MDKNKTFPTIACTISLLTLTLFFLGHETSDLLQYNRQKILSGELWRLFTGHITHWSLEHLTWDLCMFLFPAIILEKENRKDLLILLGVCSLTISLAIWFFIPQIHYYRGLSGLDSSLFTFTCVWLTRTNIRKKNHLSAILSTALGLLFIAKTYLELKNGQSLFVSQKDLFIPIPQAHLIGGIIGAAYLPLKHVHKKYSGRSRNVRQLSANTVVKKQLDGFIIK